MSAVVHDVDIAIVGDGLVGRPLAIALAHQGWRIALIDRAPSDMPNGHGGGGGHGDDVAAGAEADPLDQRCTALAAPSIDWLDRQGLWHADAASAESIHRVRVSHRGHFGATRLDRAELSASGARPSSADALGATIENRRFLAALRAPLRERIDADRVVALGGCTPMAIEHRGGRCELSLASTVNDEPAARDGSAPATGAQVSVRVCARLAIAADGSESALRGLAGIPVERTDYRQHAVLTTVQLDRAHAGLALERFTDDGPLALLPRPHACMNVVLCAPPERADALRDASDEAFLAALAARTPRRLGRWLAVGPRSSVPLVRVEAQRARSGRVLVLGNAARLLHPVAGQGYNLALRDMAALLRRLAPGPEAIVDPGAAPLLDDFIAVRAADRRATTRLTDALARGFRGRSSALGHLRAAGLLALDTVGPARRRFARVAMGDGGPGASG